MPPASALTAEEALNLTYSHEASVEKVVAASLPVAFITFQEFVWRRNAGVGPASWTKIIVQGDENHVGETRLAAGMMQEKILRITPEEEIMYTVIAGPFPVNKHLGIVKFTPEGEDKTKIVWSVKFTPKLGMGLAVKGVIKSAFVVFLNRLDKLLIQRAALPKLASPKEAANHEAETYSDLTVVEGVISGPVPAVFKKFREFVWLRTAGFGPASWTYLIDEGNKETHVGEVRKVAGIVEEKTLRYVENEMIVYTLIRGPIPMKNHLGSVTFTPEGDDKTKITWSVKYTPMTGATTAMDTLLKIAFNSFFRRLEEEMTKTPA